MAGSWNTRDGRQYREIRKSEIDRGRSVDRAEEIAARTVNKRRRLAGRTDRVTTSGTGNPNLPLEERTKDELYNRARELRIPHRSRMRKRELVTAIRDRQ